MVQEYRTAHTLIHQHIETCVCMASLSTYSDPWAMASVPRVNVASRGKGLRLAQRKARCAAAWRSGSTSRSLPEPAEREALFKIFLTDIFAKTNVSVQVLMVLRCRRPPHLPRGQHATRAAPAPG